MDTQNLFASRYDIWRVLDELRDLRNSQSDQGERLGRLERRRDEDVKMRNVWGPAPLSPFPAATGASVSTETSYNSPPDAFKGFDQDQHHTMTSSSVGLDGEDEPRRGTSRANSVRFDESAIHGSYGQAGRSSTDLPLRTGSGFGSHPLLERSLSHRSDGRQSSSGQSHHSARTNSLGLDTSRLMSSVSFSDSPLIAPPVGIFLLGPVPSIIRCWLTSNFSNDSLLYAAVCSGSYVSSVGAPLIHMLGLEADITQEDGQSQIKLPVYLPDASVHMSPSSRSSSPEAHLPTLTVRFIVRETDTLDDSIQIILGSDVLRTHNADILFSQDKIAMLDDERNRLSIPLVRPERDGVFKSLRTVPRPSDMGPASHTNGHQPAGVIGQPTDQQSSSAPVSARVSISEASKPAQQAQGGSASDAGIQSTLPTAASDTSCISVAKPEGPWSSWRRESKPDPNKQAKDKRPMKVLRPAKVSNRVASSTSVTTGTADTDVLASSLPDLTRATGQTPRSSSDGSNKTRPSNPVGGASAFGWLNSAASASKTQTPK
ncbi:hypothetical protein N7533_007561 [Penicillium manginii]|uniref:uncharacterized protein n=1 Tax=Penicillium manginii TaxID=203109 RepID=UPI002547520B|nr:uncharacterized protein N7533_007561 [Penicillium manginii]KAJ5750533.1 hypothetical protein N7533_007561 [Penicillium manginii]